MKIIYTGLYPKIKALGIPFTRGKETEVTDEQALAILGKVENEKETGFKRAVPVPAPAVPSPAPVEQEKKSK